MQTRRKPTIDEVRKKKVQQQRVKDEDQLALKFDRFERSKILKETLMKKGLDEDEAEQFARETMDELNVGEDDDGRTL